MNNNSIIYETLTELNDYLLRLIDGINKVIFYFKSADNDNGLSLLTQVIEGLAWSTEVVVKTREEFEKKQIDLDIERINELYEELASAIQNQDYIFISDLLEYDILELLNGWKKGLEKMGLDCNTRFSN